MLLSGVSFKELILIVKISNPNCKAYRYCPRKNIQNQGQIKKPSLVSFAYREPMASAVK